MRHNFVLGLIISLFVLGYYVGPVQAQQAGFIDPSFNPGTGFIDNPTGTGNNFSGSVYALALQPDGKVLVGGRFTTFNGVARNFMARLNSDGSLDATFNARLNSITNNNVGTVRAIALQADGKIIVGGSLISVNGSLPYNLFRLNSDGSQDASFAFPAYHPLDNVWEEISGILVQPDGKIIAGNLSKSVRLNANGSIDPTFTSIGGFNAIALQPDGKIITVHNPQYGSKGIARYNSDGSQDLAFPFADRGFVSDGGYTQVNAVALQPDGKMIVAGAFSTYNGIRQQDMARLNPDGSLDPTFTLLTSNATIYCLGLQPDGKIISGGEITVRRNSDGTGDNSFRGSFYYRFSGNTRTSTHINALVLQPDGKVLAGGDFTEVNIQNTSTNINRIVRLHGGPVKALQNQTITFNPIADKYSNDPPFALSATASSGLPVTFSVVSGPATITGNTVTLSGSPGTVTIRASQEGNADYNAAPPVDRSFTVNVVLASYPTTNTAQISVAPNPATQVLHVTLPNATGSASLRLLNSTGQQIVTMAGIEQSRVNIPVKHLSRGLYLLHIQQDKTNIIRKVILY